MRALLLRVPLALVTAFACAQAGCSADSSAPNGSPSPSETDPIAKGAAATDAGPPLGAPTTSSASCTNDAKALRTFGECPAGGGAFGKWIVDRGLPAFSFEMDQRTDPRGEWTTTMPGRSRRDHFHVTGNARLNVIAADDGYVTLFGNERGPTLMNRYAEDQNNLAGGFSYVKDGAGVYSTMFKLSPAGATTRRVFGMSYFETETEVSGLRVKHTIHAPFGDDPFVLDDVEVTNTSGVAKDVAHYEYWDVNRHQLETEWIRTGYRTDPGDRDRDLLNAGFTQAVTYDGAAKTLTATMTPVGWRPPMDSPGEVDAWPAPVFLTCLSGEVDDVHTDQDRFLGSDIRKPASVVAGSPGGQMGSTDATGQKAALVMRSNLALAAGQTRTMRFAYGYVPQGKTAAAAARFATVADPLADTLASWRTKLAYVAVPGMPYLQRETAWRSQLLQAQTVHNDYWGTSYTPQGSAYLYLHGVDGVARDQSLYAVATTYLDPSLAKGNLRMAMGVTDAKDGHKWYSFEGYGKTGDALGLHTWPSDLDIYFLFALAEYLDATGDVAFLSEQVDFYPHGSASLPPGATGRTVLDHARVAFRHLRDAVGRGGHGLVHIGDGDWSDGIVYQDLSPTAQASTKLYGESVPNTQMAAYALPLAADALTSADPSLAGELRAYATLLSGAAKAAFGTRWFGRAWLNNSIGQSYLMGNDQLSDAYRANHIDLEAQPWGLVAGVLDDASTTRVLDEIELRLDTPSKVGPTLTEGGMVWPAISQLMTWAYARHRPASAWRSLSEQLYATHAANFPSAWGGTLSAPDGLNSGDGLSWASPATPMSDFPVANANPDAMWILGLLRTAGVEPTKGGLSITPRGAPGYETYTLDLPLMKLDVAPRHINGIYRAKNDGRLSLRVAIGAPTATVTIGGAQAPATVTAGVVVVPLTFHAGDEVAFEVTGGG